MQVSSERKCIRAFLLRSKVISFVSESDSWRASAKIKLWTVVG